jgi:hypothetical protein
LKLHSKFTGTNLTSDAYCSLHEVYTRTLTENDEFHLCEFLLPVLCH